MIVKMLQPIRYMLERHITAIERRHINFKTQSHEKGGKTCCKKIIDNIFHGELEICRETFKKHYPNFHFVAAETYFVFLNCYIF